MKELMRIIKKVFRKQNEHIKDLEHRIEVLESEMDFIIKNITKN